jgi:hypothetical protein
MRKKWLLLRLLPKRLRPLPLKRTPHKRRTQLAKVLLLLMARLLTKAPRRERRERVDRAGRPLPRRDANQPAVTSEAAPATDTNGATEQQPVAEATTDTTYPDRRETREQRFDRENRDGREPRDNRDRQPRNDQPRNDFRENREPRASHAPPTG